MTNSSIFQSQGMISLKEAFDWRRMRFALELSPLSSCCSSVHFFFNKNAWNPTDYSLPTFFTFWRYSMKFFALFSISLSGYCTILLDDFRKVDEQLSLPLLFSLFSRFKSDRQNDLPVSFEHPRLSLFLNSSPKCIPKEYSSSLISSLGVNDLGFYLTDR